MPPSALFLTFVIPAGLPLHALFLISVIPNEVPPPLALIAIFLSEQLLQLGSSLVTKPAPQLYARLLATLISLLPQA